MPPELEEGAAVDGVDTYRILLRIVLPLSKGGDRHDDAVLRRSPLELVVHAFLYLDHSTCSA